MNWFVLYVKSNNEKKVAKRLMERGFEIFCPVKIEERQWSDRVKKVEVPYFRSYVFAKFSESDANEILETAGVVRRLFWLGQPAIISDKEMQEVISFFETHTDIEMRSYIEGKDVEIKQGAFKGKKGIILTQDKHQVTLQIPALGCGFRVRVNKTSLQ